MRQLLSCINYCHARNIVHRDIKPENILLESNKDFSQIKIIDFGISVVKEPEVFIEESIGTPYYIAPEVWKKKYDEKCDVWSCGVIMYILLSGTPPFNAASDAEMKEKILDGSFSLSGKVWDTISEEAKDLVTKLLTYEIEERISANDALAHSWITNTIDSEIDSKVAKKALENLSQFRAEEKIKQATIAYIASQLLSKKEKESLSSIFKAFDENSDGRLSKKEFINGYEKIFGQTIDQEKIAKIFDSVDLDKSGFIDYSEFVVATMNEKNLFSEKKLAAAFKMFDTDSSGSISRKEVKEALLKIQKFTEDELQEIIGQVDKDGDGEISFDEFKIIMTNLKN
jgi:calcium-dependent protein kinase